MRSAAFLIMATTTLTLIGVTHYALVFSASTPPGMLNPTLHFWLHPDARETFYSTLLASAVSTYSYAMISWTEGKLDQLRDLIHEEKAMGAVGQPMEIHLLKEAIRAGDPAAVKKYAKKSALLVVDEHYFTPLELAELYEQQPVIDALTAAMLKHGQRKAPPGQRTKAPISQFALRNH